VFEVVKNLLKDREGDIVKGRSINLNFEKVTLEELSADYINYCQIHKPKELVRAKQVVQHLHSSPQFERDRLVVDITTDLVNQYIAQRQGKKAADATINRELAGLKRMLSLGVANVPAKVAIMPKIPMLKLNNARSGYFEQDEFLALRGALPDHVKTPATLGYYTGMRSGEILNLRWDQVDLKEGKLLLSSQQTKNKRPRLFYLDMELSKWLIMAKEIRDRLYPYCPWVCSRDGQRLKSFRRSWKTALKRIGLEGMLFHDFRRTVVRDMVRAGVPENDAMRISGHRTRSVFDRYNIGNEEDLKVAAMKLSVYHQSKSVGIDTGICPQMRSSVQESVFVSS
jgi:integrase